MNTTPLKQFAPVVLLVWGIIGSLTINPAMAQTNAMTINPVSCENGRLKQLCGPTAENTCDRGVYLTDHDGFFFACGYGTYPACPVEGVSFCDTTETLEQRVEAVESRWNWGPGITPAYLFTPGENVSLMEIGAELNLRITGSLFAAFQSAWAPAHLDGENELSGNSNFAGIRWEATDHWRFGIGWRSVLIWSEDSEGEGDLLQTHLGELQAGYQFDNGFQLRGNAGWGHGEWAAMAPQEGTFPAGFDIPQVPTQESGFGVTRLALTAGWIF